MKLHLRNIRHYAVCSSPADKEGYLSKKGEVNTSYQRRWFVLRGNILFYFDKKGDREPVGLIILENTSIQLCESEEEHAFSIVYEGPSQRTYKLAADDQQTLEAWLKVLLSSMHSYIQMLVKDLKAKYEEAYLAAGRDSSHRHTVPEVSTNTWNNMDYLNIHYGSSVTSFSKTLDPVGRECRSYSMNSLLDVPSKPLKKGSKPWSKHPPVTQQPQLDNVHTVSEVPQDNKWTDEHSLLTDEFSVLHEKFGSQIQELRQQWKKKKPLQLEATVEDLIDLS